MNTNDSIKRVNRIRHIVATVFAVLGIGIVAYVCAVWYGMCCDWRSLVAAVAWHGGGTLAIWLVTDQTLKEIGEHRC